MAERIHIDRATLDHVNEIVPRLRQADVDEIAAASTLTAMESVAISVRFSAPACVGYIDGEIAALFGVCPTCITAGRGVPWLVATDAVERKPLPFLRACREAFPALIHGYTHLSNWVDDRNAAAIHWLKWLGFEMGEPQPWGPYSTPFRNFQMRA